MGRETKEENLDKIFFNCPNCGVKLTKSRKTGYGVKYCSRCECNWYILKLSKKDLPKPITLEERLISSLARRLILIYKSILRIALAELNGLKYSEKSLIDLNKLKFEEYQEVMVEAKKMKADNDELKKWNRYYYMKLTHVTNTLEKDGIDWRKYFYPFDK